MNQGKRQTWKTIRKDGRPALRSPSGEVYYGTPSEVREAALMPWRRDALAKSQRLARYLAETGTYSPDELREVCAENRREAIRQRSVDAAHGTFVEIPAKEYILLCAGSRLVRNGVKDFFAELWRSEIDALLDVAEAETGRREIPLTRHERAALERLRETSEA